MLNDENKISIYRKYFDKTLEEILLGIKNSFIKYYGDSNKDKIESVFKNLSIVYVGNNMTFDNLDKNIIEAEEEYNYHIDSILSRSVNLEENDIINFILGKYDNLKSKDAIDKLDKIKTSFIKKAFYSWVEKSKKDDINPSVVLGSNNPSLSCELLELGSSLPIYAEGASNPFLDDENVIYIKIKQGKISLSSLIHEINHQLQKEELAYGIFGNERKVIRTTGITGKPKDMLNELMNEYVSMDVLEIFKSSYEVDNSIVNDHVNSGYISIDKITGNYGMEIYKLLNSVIKNNLISGNSEIIKKIINTDNKHNYDNLNGIYTLIQADMINKINNKEISNANEYASILDDKTKEQYKSFCSNIFNSIKKSYEKFIDYESNLQSQIDYLVKEGKARRL